MGCGSGVTCWRRLRDWQAGGVWNRLHELLLAKLRSADQIDFSRAAVDSSHHRSAPLGLAKNWPNPTDRARPGSKYHIVTDANGTPLPAILTGANVHDVTQLLPLIDAIAPIRGLRSHPLQRPLVVYADRGYDSERVAQARYRAGDRQAPHRTRQRPEEISLGR